MSNTSIKSCGPINCHLEPAKKFEALKPKISFCRLPSCVDNNPRDSPKSPFELKQLFEYCKPSNCARFWDSVSTKTDFDPPDNLHSIPENKIKPVVIKKTDRAYKIFDKPECDNADCPKKIIPPSSKNILRPSGENIQIHICGPPNCCTKPSPISGVGFGLACDLVTKQCQDLYEEQSVKSQNSRNKVFFCVSRSFYKELELTSGINEGYHYASTETVRSSKRNQKYCPHLECCGKDTKGKSKDTISVSMNRQRHATDASIQDLSEAEDVVTSFHTFHSQSKITDKPEYKRGNQGLQPEILNISPLSRHSIRSSYILRELKEYTKSCLTSSQDFPSTPPTSNTIFFTEQSQYSPFKTFPLSPDDINSKQESIVQNYLYSNDSKTTNAVNDSEKVTHRNQSKVQALLHSIYLTKADDFPPTPTLQSLEKVSNLKKAEKKESIGLMAKDNNSKKAEEMKNNVQEKIVKVSKEGIGSLEKFLSKNNGLNKAENTKKDNFKNTYKKKLNGPTKNTDSTLEKAFVKKPNCCVSKPGSKSQACCTTFDETNESGKVSCPLQALGNNNYLKTNTLSCSEDKQRESDTCYPKTCDKLSGLSGLRKWKNCCNSKLCPINDPTTSTYDFLLKVRMCCKKRGCQLAAKICDIYEPLVKIDSNFEDIGEPQYHYLASDASTEMVLEKPIETAEPEKTIDVIHSAEPPEHLIVRVSSSADHKEESHTSTLMTVTDVNPDEIDAYPEMPDEPANELSEIKKKIALATDSNIESPEDFYRTTRRTSTVSWNMPPSAANPTSSQEQVISKATAEADRFRQTPVSQRHASVFGEIVRKPPVDEPVELNKVQHKSEKFKSQLGSIRVTDSEHKQKCCPLLRNKFKRKKKKRRTVDENDDSSLSWRSPEHEKRKANITVVPVQEKDQQISNILDKMY